MKKKYLAPITHDTKIHHAPIMVDVTSEGVDWGDAKKRKKANEDPVDSENDESKDSFWSN